MIRGIRLEDLLSKAPGMPEGTAAHYQHSCMMCMDHHGHASGVHLHVDFEGTEDHMSVSWLGTVTEETRRWFRDQEKRVDFGACAIALLIVPEFTSLIAVEQSAKGNGIDYYLADSEANDDLIFNHAALLEVSGIQTETPSNTVNDRIASKRRRLNKIAASSASMTKDIPTYICVVEFGQPKTKVVLA